MKENIPFEKYLPCDGKVFTVEKIKYKIHARIHHAIYPYVHDYVNLTAEYKEKNAGNFGMDKTWFLDLKQSESKTCDRIRAKIERSLAPGE